MAHVSLLQSTHTETRYLLIKTVSEIIVNIWYEVKPEKYLGISQFRKPFVNKHCVAW